jgi:hypothetical protein
MRRWGKAEIGALGLSLALGLGWSGGTATAQTVEILAAPLYLAGDGGEQGGTPAAIYARLTGGQPSSAYYVKAYLVGHSSSARTWNGSSTTWVASGRAWTEQRQVTTDANGEWSGWLQSYFYTSTIGSPKTLRVSVRSVGGGDPITGDLAGITVMDMSSTGDGAWVHGVAAAATAGRVILALDASGNLLGSYVVEDNGIAEAPNAYSSTPGYFRFAVPANAAIARLEVRNSANEVVEAQNGLWRAGAAGTDTDLDAQEDVSLPVVLASFGARRTEAGTVEVRWASVSEFDIAGYYVCRSVEGVPGPGDAVSELIRATGQGSGASYVWVDASPPSAGRVWYALYAVELDGNVRLLSSSVVLVSGMEPAQGVPREFYCTAPYPNPFGEKVGAPAVFVRWWGGPWGPSSVLLSLFDVRGRLVCQARLGGEGIWSWDGTDARGRPAPAGNYLLRLTAGKEVRTAKISLIR